MFGFLFKKKPRPKPRSEAHQPENGPDDEVQAEVVFKLNSKTAPSIKEIDTRFMGMMLGVNSLLDKDLNPAEKKSLLQIRALSSLEDLPDNMVPRLPSVIPKIMIAIRNENSNAQDLAELISSDLSLVGEVIRLSNSAYYRTGFKVKSLKQAIQKLGMDGIHQLVSSAAFKPILVPKHGKLSGTLSKFLWKKNQRAAIAGNYLALQTGDDGFHAYLAGLLTQAGILVIVKQIDENFDGMEIPDSIEFMEQLDWLSKKITVQIGRQWDVPSEIVQALEEQLNDNAPAQISSLGQVCYVADRLAKISLHEEHGQLDEMGHELQCRVGKINTRSCKRCYSFIKLDLQAI